MRILLHCHRNQPWPCEVDMMTQITLAAKIRLVPEILIAQETQAAVETPTAVTRMAHAKSIPSVVSNSC